MAQKEEILVQIEAARSKLSAVGSCMELNDSRVIRLSMALDELINLYYDKRMKEGPTEKKEESG